ncbi:MAG: DNA repair protein RecN [Lachnospiraceae bacterium]|nr:DNA repair protein RecN [Lachnospiraceae bacterium]
MLLSVHVKNMALIEEAEVEFTPGLNVLTGETGAGKSILLGSVNLALGAKADKEMIRNGAEYAQVELVFTAEERVLRKLEEMELPTEEDCVTISRRISGTRSVSRINGESVSAKQIKELAELLLDIHGQHEHQSLLHKRKHLEILDAYAGSEALSLLDEVGRCYRERNRLKEDLDAQSMDEGARRREQELLEFEAKEIEEAGLKEGEDEELEKKYRRMLNSRRISESLGSVYRLTDGEEGAISLLGRAVKELGSVASYDEALGELSSQLAETESLLRDFNRELSDYQEDMEFDGADFQAVETRLNLINHLKEKYGRNISSVLEYGEEIQRKIEKLNDYENYMKELSREYEKADQALHEACKKLSVLRKEKAPGLEETLKKALEELNFLSIGFEVSIKEKEISSDGGDEVEFLISTNPGESLKPLSMVSSGGELSRIMLGVKTVLADKDEVDTLIFDEIDAGISGRTAWKVSEKLGALSGAHQVILITHLPQIAAMADTHFLIEKETDGSSTATDIRRLSRQGVVEELARLLGTDNLSDAALSNAEELMAQAAKIKQN